jgi:SAM-dependent methyltransferase
MSGRQRRRIAVVASGGGGSCLRVVAGTRFIVVHSRSSRVPSRLACLGGPFLFHSVGMNPPGSEKPSAYPETADIAGAWMLGVQERIVLDWVAQRGRPAVLDVGGGHAQLAVPLAQRGFDVTVLGSDASCGERLRGVDVRGRLDFVVGNVVALPFEDRSFDVVVSIRLLAHCQRWQALIGEMCRVAREAVIVDYPTRRSLNCMTALLFGAKKKLEGNTRPYTLFNDRDIERAFADRGFALCTRRPEFFVPMVVHRMLKCPVCSKALEAVAAGLGLRHGFGSPVLAEFSPQPGKTTGSI